MTLDDITIAKIADAVAVRIAGPYQSRTDAVYTSYHLPPDVKNRTYFHQLARRVPGSVKRGKCWVVPVDAWDRYRDGPSNNQADSDQSDHIRMVLRNAGLM